MKNNNTNFKIGELVWYKHKFEINCVKEVISDGKSYRTWSHLGNTAGLGPADIFKKATRAEIVEYAKDNLSNQYMISSFIQRREAYKLTGDVNSVDLADDLYDIKFIEKYNFDKEIKPNKGA